MVALSSFTPQELQRVPGVYIAGNWRFPFNSPVNAGTVQGSTLARGIMFQVRNRKPITISDLGCRITTAGTGNMQLALYNADQSTLHPTTNIDKTASISTASGGTPWTAALGANQRLIPWNYYWLFGQLDSTASGNAVIAQSFATEPILGAEIGDPTFLSVSVSNSSGFNSVSFTNTFGTWGDFTGSTYTCQGGANHFAIGFKVASVP